MEIVRHHFKQLASTQDWAKEHLGQFDPAKFTVISAEEQTKGRGRFDKKWFSPRGCNIYVTYYFTLPELSFPKEPITLVLALSIAEVLQKLGLQPKIKWPNDVMIHGKKISGILAETQIEGPLTHLFVGYGLNVNMDPELLSELDIPATSILAETKKEWGIRMTQEQVEKIFLRNLHIFREKGFEAFAPDFEYLSFLSGKKIRIEFGNEIFEGLYLGITPDGGMKLKLSDHQEKVFHSGMIKAWEGFGF